MPYYRKESLETLRQKVDLVEVLSTYIDLKSAGSAYKALCPFHDEKTASFTVQRGDSHYHCFGCSAHGDAISFLMEYQKMNFVEAVESLAQKFGVHLEYEESNGKEARIHKKPLYDALNLASRFYHFILLNTEEGHQALDYLFDRGIDLDFIKTFQLGLAPSNSALFQKTMEEKKVSFEILEQVGLIKARPDGGYRDFFYDRITIPIHQPSGNVIAFSARKYKEETFGGKYVNSPETPVFKKSRTLFGLNYSRRRIAKEQKAILVEGQLDALRLIKEGFDISVASQGTAFGQEHVGELIRLGINLIYLAFDSDNAGKEATIKIGNLFQKEGIEVLVVEMPLQSDPDTFLREQGADLFLELLNGGTDYLTFLVRFLSQRYDMSSPAGKNNLVKKVGTQIRTWSNDVMVHESLKKLAKLTQLPEEFVGVDYRIQTNVFVKQSDTLSSIQGIDPHRILESDLLRWLLTPGNQFETFKLLITKYLSPAHFKDEECRKIYESIIEQEKREDLLSFVSKLDEPEQILLSQILDKKVNPDYAEAHFVQTIQKILEREWMEKREKIKMKIESGECSDEEALKLLKEFDQLKNAPPIVHCEG